MYRLKKKQSTILLVHCIPVHIAYEISSKAAICDTNKTISSAVFKQTRGARIEDNFGHIREAKPAVDGSHRVSADYLNSLQFCTLLLSLHVSSLPCHVLCMSMLVYLKSCRKLHAQLK